MTARPAVRGVALAGRLVALLLAPSPVGSASAAPITAVPVFTG